MAKLSLRPASVADASGCAAIYAPYVLNTAISFEEIPPSAVQMTERIRHKSTSHGWFVATEADRLLGFAYAGTYREREAWQWVCETSIYLDPLAAGRGVGRQLYGVLLEHLAARGFRVAVASIALPNAASVALHQSLGFEHFGTSPGVGFKHHQWIDVAWFQRHLGSGTTTPAEPLQASVVNPGQGAGSDQGVGSASR
ncbi:MAG: GNAT family N-acetyltransferase [Propionibacteriaceae bacterium]|nr:GNAT family N-acetyltransferase [Propionibacteriaceae bacterium]